MAGDACECAFKGHHDDGDEECLAEFDHGNGTLLCSRPEGHDGAHAACNYVEHPIMAWTDDWDEEKEATTG